MRTRLFVMVAGIGSLLLAAAPMLAHHAFSSEFDASKPIKLEGTIKKVEWINPHSWITIDVKQANGTTQVWEIEAGAPNAMFRRGFNRNSLPVGTQIVVNGYQAKDGKQRANGRDLTFPDGKRLFLGTSNTAVPAEEREPAAK